MAGDSIQTTTDWQPIATAPKNGSPIQAEIPGQGSDNVIAWLGGLENQAGDECYAWQFVSEQEPPDSWDDGICWTINSDGKPSVCPTRWKMLPDTRIDND